MGVLHILLTLTTYVSLFQVILIYDKGKIWELYSLQKGQQTTDYHGFLGARDELKDSLEKVGKSLPTALIPTHGVVMKILMLQLTRFFTN